MTHVPHLRLSLNGTLPNSEIFSCNLSLRVDGRTETEFLDWFSGNSTTIGDENFADLVADCTAFWGRVQTGISSRAVLTRIKLAPIGSNGRYSGPAREAAVNVAGPINPGDVGGTGEMLPHQIARKVTLETDGDLARVKGGFFLPGVVRMGYDASTDLTSATFVADVRDSVKTFIDAVNNAPGLDASGSYTVVIASQGRVHNGVQTIPPTLFPVKRVNVGRRLDVQRRRANKITEARITDAAVA